MQCISINQAAVFHGNNEDIHYSFIFRHCILNYTMLELHFWPVFLTVTNSKMELTIC